MLNGTELREPPRHVKRLAGLIHAACWPGCWSLRSLLEDDRGEVAAVLVQQAAVGSQLALSRSCLSSPPFVAVRERAPRCERASHAHV